MVRWLTQLMALALLLFIPLEGLAASDASGVVNNRQAMYEQAKALLSSGDATDLTEAKRYFEALGIYEDCVQYLLYTQALLQIEDGSYDEAIENLTMLHAVSFEDSGHLMEYAKGRRAEAGGDYAAAYKYYYGQTVRDSLLRFKNMKAILDQPQPSPSLPAYVPPEPTPEPVDEVYTFLDSALERAIRSELGIASGDVHLSDLERVIQIEAVKKGIRRLDDLAVCPNVRVLHLDDNKISSLEPLRNCTQLEDLQLRGSPVWDLEPISQLTSIRVLVLRATDVDDIALLKGLTNMTDLVINHISITDLSALSGMKKMRNIHLNNNAALKDLSVLSGLPNLEVVDIRKCPGIDKQERAWLKDILPAGCKIVT